MSWFWHRGSGRVWKAVKHWIAPGGLSTWVQLRRALLTTTSQLCSLGFIRRLSIGFLCCFQILCSPAESISQSKEATQSRLPSALSGRGSSSSSSSFDAPQLLRILRTTPPHSTTQSFCDSERCRALSSSYLSAVAAGRSPSCPVNHCR
jgi:hypothetical protein